MKSAKYKVFFLPMREIRKGVSKVEKKLEIAKEEKTRPMRESLSPSFFAMNGYKGARRLYPTSEIMANEIRIKSFEDI